MLLRILFVIVMNVFSLVFTLCAGIVMQIMKINGLLGMSDPVIPRCLSMEQIFFLTFLLGIGAFAMQIAWVGLFLMSLHILKCISHSSLYIPKCIFRSRLHTFLVQSPGGNSSQTTGPACKTLLNYGTESLRAEFCKKCNLKPTISLPDRQWWLSCACKP